MKKSSIKIPARKVVADNVPMDYSKSCIIFDIETIPQDEEKLLILAPNFEPDSRLKDPEKIAANIELQKKKYIERAALDWKTAQVALIGFSDGELYVPLTGNEDKIIADFFKLMVESLTAGAKIGGHNVKSFDLPMLVNRARVLRIPVPTEILSFWRGRPTWNDNIFDTLEMFSFGDRSRIEGCGVDDICRILGLKGKTADGSQFPSMWRNDKAAAIAYNARDCELEIEIAKVCGFKFSK